MLSKEIWWAVDAWCSTWENTSVKGVATAPWVYYILYRFTCSMLQITVQSCLPTQYNFLILFIISEIGLCCRIRCSEITFEEGNIWRNCSCTYMIMWKENKFLTNCVTNLNAIRKCEQTVKVKCVPLSLKTENSPNNTVWLYVIRRFFSQID